MRRDPRDEDDDGQQEDGAGQRAVEALRAPNRTMKPDRIRHLPSYLWVLAGPGLVVLSYLIGLALFDLLGAGYLRSFARRLFGL
jgi:hypothetical protein